MFLEAAVDLNVLLGDEHEQLFELEQVVAKEKLDLLDGQSKINVSEVKLRVEAGDNNKKMKLQKANIDRIVEFIRLAKVHARLASDEYKG